MTEEELGKRSLHLGSGQDLHDLHNDYPLVNERVTKWKSSFLIDMPSPGMSSLSDFHIQRD